MVKDIHIQKVDLRVPLEIFGKIEEIAIKTNQPHTPRSKNTDNPKPVVTSVILKAIELALGKLENELIEELSEGKALTNPIISDSLEDRIFKRLEVRLEAKLDELIETKLKRLTAVTITPEVKEDLSELIENKESAIENNSEKIDPPEDTEAITPEVVNEPNEVIEVKEVSAVKDDSKTFEDTVKKIKKLNSQGLNYSQIAKKLTEGNYPTKQGSLNWVGNQVKRILSKP